MEFNEYEKVANQKEKEWKEATAMQIKSLQERMSFKDHELKNLQHKFTQLKDDFKFNLKLLEERDRELKHYDEEMAKSKVFMSEYTNVISDLKIKIANFNEKLQNEKKSKKEMGVEFRKQITNQQIEIENLRRTKRHETDALMQEKLSLKFELENKIKFMQTEIDCQKVEFNNELEEMSRKRNMEDLAKWENKNEEVLSHELKSKLLSKELEIMKTNFAKQSQQMKTKNDEAMLLKQQLQKAEYNCKDISSMKNAKIIELEAEVSERKENEIELKEEFCKKHAELDKDVRLKQLSLDESRKAFLDKETNLKKQIFLSKKKIKSIEAEVNRALKDKAAFEKSSQETIATMREEIKVLKTKLHHSASTANKHKTESLNLKRQVDFLNTELDKYKKEVASQNEEKSLKLDCFNSEANVDKQYGGVDFDNIIRNLTEDKNEALAEIEVLKQKLASMGSDDDYIAQRNNHLQKIIEKMSEEMQVLATSGSNSRYVEELEEELILLRKQKNVDVKTPEPIDISNNSDLEMHIASLNKLINNLRSDKLQLNAENQKLKVRLEHFDQRSETLHMKDKRTNAKVQELEYENMTMKKRFEEEKKTLCKQIDDLQLSVAESRREADAYYKQGISNNLIASELDSKITKMKVDFASTSNFISNDSHKLLMDQLQQENTRLRSELAHAKQLLIFGDGQKISGNLSSKLFEKLKEAANQIAMLMREKQQLQDEVSKLQKSIITEKPVERVRNNNAAKDANKTNNKTEMKQLENLQYELTKHELQFAQRDKPPPSVQIPKPAKSYSVQVYTEPAAASQPHQKVTKPVNQNVTLSSFGDSEIKDVWKLLDDNISSAENTAVQTIPTKQIATKPKVSSIPRYENRKRKPLKPKIRNYNIKD